MGLVTGVKAAEINVKNDVSAQKEEVLPQLVLQEKQGSGGAQRLRLRDVFYPYAEGAAVAEVVLHHMAQMPHHKDDVVIALPAQAVDLIFQNRLSQNGDHGLGHLGIDRGNSRALAAGHDYGFHRVSPLGM